MSAQPPPGRGVLDTSTVILLRSLADPSALPAEPLITAVTLAELSVGPLVAIDRRERAGSPVSLQRAEADFDRLPFDADGARAFGRVAACLRRSGRRTSARTYDAMIAATALAHDLPLYTCNPADFAGIDDLHVIAVNRRTVGSRPHPRAAGRRPLPESPLASLPTCARAASACAPQGPSGAPVDVARRCTWCMRRWGVGAGGSGSVRLATAPISSRPHQTPIAGRFTLQDQPPPGGDCPNGPACARKG